MMDKETEKTLPFTRIEEYKSFDREQARILLDKELEDFNQKIMVLDDDPTGTQTVHGIDVYTDWEQETLDCAFDSQDQMFFILTNSRSFSEKQTEKVHREIALRTVYASRRANKPVFVISRGDSTLRGHYPLETETLMDAFVDAGEVDFDGEILCPFFPEGGRYTVNNIHYVKEGQMLLQAGETEFAKDKTFGYSSSDLTMYVQEKSGGLIPAESCVCITLDDLAGGDFYAIEKKLSGAHDRTRIIVNAIDYTDLEVFCTALLRSIKKGKHYIARSAAAFPKILGSVPDQPLLTKKRLFYRYGAEEKRAGGIVIVGSHVKRTTAQLEELKKSEAKLDFIEFNIKNYFEENGLEKEKQEVQSRVEKSVLQGITAVIYTSRSQLVPKDTDPEKALSVSVEISKALTKIIAELKVEPSFILAKGGITSSDVAKDGLKIKKARVMGQIRPGIPVWETGQESRFPAIPYIIFPGNVGEIQTLREIIDEICT